ncbi:MAG TPA: head-tail connector protein [Nitrobacter sp.]|nr:head-tail connector protein [Nitrobacter sp.]
MLAPVLVTPPDITPVSSTDVKAQLHVDHTDDDAMIGALLTAATEHFDRWTGILGRCLVEQTWRQEFACFAGCLRLPLAPVLSVESITYFDGENAQQTLDASVYVLLADARGPYVGLKPDQSWPGSYSRRDAISVTFKAGYATTPVQGETPAQSTVPEPIKLAIILQVKLNYDPLELAVRESYQRAIDALVAPFRRVGV